jgi:hypothetical protein
MRAPLAGTLKERRAKTSRSPRRQARPRPQKPPLGKGRSEGADMPAREMEAKIEVEMAVDDAWMPPGSATKTDGPGRGGGTGAVDFSGRGKTAAKDGDEPKTSLVRS